MMTHHTDQKLEFLSLSASELEPAINWLGLYSQIYCVLQTGYFKVKHTFFRFACLIDSQSVYILFLEG
ncbi:hypothetical protein C6H68_02635 [Photorhabdus luminescens]|uniref:Uncharacterized protein n=1 Tax=Photorhabdus laumondii subsp. clarkei TaxID=2029685 RepID=A0A329VLC7_9GAMM|nr:hypothetical protein C6H68_02635 [Photorhabdus luminescens]RAW91847.1 hypothetical protein CKY01_06600 [Photorhabdus laumondii subsp. clarkei]